MKSLLYTRTGDTGTTSLVGGERVRKDSLRLEAYGTLDEFSAFLGVILSNRECPDNIKVQLFEVQNRLFDLGAYLATAPAPDTQPLLPGIEEDTRTVEQWIDTLDNETPKIRAFVLPGGSELCAQAHVARTVCRRTERRILALSATEWVDPALIGYINRLSDWLFILARYFNHLNGIPEITWQPRK